MLLPALPLPQSSTPTHPLPSIAIEGSATPRYSYKTLSSKMIMGKVSADYHSQLLTLPTSSLTVRPCPSSVCRVLKGEGSLLIIYSNNTEGSYVLWIIWLYGIYGTVWEGCVLFPFLFMWLRMAQNVSRCFDTHSSNPKCSTDFMA